MADFWLPNSARPTFRCLMPGCDAVFYKTEERAYVKHVAMCSERNVDKLEEHIAAKEASPFTSIADKEQHYWVRQVAAGVRNPKSKGVVVDPVKS